MAKADWVSEITQGKLNFEVGAELLNGLELASEFQWSLAHADVLRHVQLKTEVDDAKIDKATSKHVNVDVSTLNVAVTSTAAGVTPAKVIGKGTCFHFAYVS